MQKVIGVGGVFFKASDPQALAKWYQEQLGIGFGDQLYVEFKSNNTGTGNPDQTVFSLFQSDSNHFNPSDKPFMINFRVANLEALMVELKGAGVTIVKELESYDDYGKFSAIMDPEGNKLELWEPPAENL